MNKKISLFLSLSIALTSGLTFYSAAAEETLDVKFLILAIVVLFSEFFEIKDHLEHTHDHHDAARKPLLPLPGIDPPNNYSSTNQSQTTNVLLNRTSTISTIVKGSATICTLPFFGFACYGLWCQSKSLMDFFNISTKLTFIPAIFLWGRYALIPVSHTIRNIWSQEGVEKFTARVTHTGERKGFIQNKAVLFFTFLGLSGTHLPESFLLSNKTKGWKEILSILGLSIPRAIAHLDHVRALPQTLKEVWQKNRKGKLALLCFAACGAGLIHASPALLSTFYYWDKTDIELKIAMGTTVGIETLTGAGEFLQHGGQHALKFFTSKTIGNPNVNTENEDVEAAAPSVSGTIGYT
ncbi:hypothetical protein AYM02_08050 [Coxiella burnetii]|uniref:hypothetical protein n=1 Tax=Coxiella burnetii TaxID=777 RepID=UPI00030A57CD|nr:hypothetical protein [Coxiella burnetii]AML49260.1 hypothetical protein AUR58_08795 [Coxiella burnetii]AML55195.1 hypothetical protein AYM38_07950 [Coxiella burnetii]ATN69174.1 hypothetical protein AYM00_08360 [Coxiella burnetii]ATN71090.1 hypothetical protein AYM02_08050 [Coxiella burnetii]ATN73002.1 hypothetical protein AYM11_07825 [Coxiella burnetii]